MQKQSPRQLAQLFIVLVLLFGLGVKVQPALAIEPVPSTFVVNSTGDEPLSSAITCLPSEPCTLRAAIEMVNFIANPLGTLITFSIPDNNLFKTTTIKIGSALPKLTVTNITIQGPNLLPSPFPDYALVLDGKDGDYPGLEIGANDCKIKSLTIQNFADYGIVVDGSGSTVSGTVISGNKIGDLSPSTPLTDERNFGGISLIKAENSIIGGNTAADRNIISGNMGEGIYIQGGGFNLVRGNYIGTNVNGTDALLNYVGIYIKDSFENTIGGPGAEYRNVISGNTMQGVYILGNNNEVRGNFIGTNAEGIDDIPNQYGIRVGSTGTIYEGNQIGGPNPQYGNLISGNSMYALDVFNAKTTHIEGNTIGLNYAEDAAIHNGFGIIVNNSSGTEIFGFANVIAGNLQQGMQIVFHSSNTFVGGNFVGVNREGTAFGNGMAGILVMSSDSTTIGSDGLARNTIAHNGGDGIELRSSLALVEGNLIYRNGELGIDVSQSPAQFGVTPNDADEADEIQNFPVVTDVSFPETGKVRIEGYVITKPSEEVQLRIYGNEVCDPSGHGEGQVLLDMRAVDTDESGLAEFAFDSELPSAAVAGPLLFYTTTAYTETYGSSEFSACHAPYSVYLPLIMR